VIWYSTQMQQHSMRFNKPSPNDRWSEQAMHTFACLIKQCSSLTDCLTESSFAANIDHGYNWPVGRWQMRLWCNVAGLSGWLLMGPFTNQWLLQQRIHWLTDLFVALAVIWQRLIAEDHDLIRGSSTWWIHCVSLWYGAWFHNSFTGSLMSAAALSVK
jgi:hypothetical protein